MNVYLNEIDGVSDAIVTMFMSKRSWTRELEEEIRHIGNQVLTKEGKMLEKKDIAMGDIPQEYFDKYNEWLDKLTKWGKNHITMLRFVDMSFTVEGLHRAGQDDWDAHAQRFNNRIIRSSTRLASFGYEMSDYYKDKIVSTDIALRDEGIEIPDFVIRDGVKYVKAVNGYIREDLKDNSDVKRGLYMLSIPSNFKYKVNLTEFAHVYKERNINGTANPEVKHAAEMMADQIEQFIPQFNRELFLAIKN